MSAAAASKWSNDDNNDDVSWERLGRPADDEAAVAGQIALCSLQLFMEKLLLLLHMKSANLHFPLVKKYSIFARPKTNLFLTLRQLCKPAFHLICHRRLVSLTRCHKLSKKLAESLTRGTILTAFMVFFSVASLTQTRILT